MGSTSQNFIFIIAGFKNRSLRKRRVNHERNLVISSCLECSCFRGWRLNDDFYRIFFTQAFLAESKYIIYISTGVWRLTYISAGNIPRHNESPLIQHQIQRRTGYTILSWNVSMNFIQLCIYLIFLPDLTFRDYFVQSIHDVYLIFICAEASIVLLLISQKLESERQHKIHLLLVIIGTFAAIGVAQTQEGTYVDSDLPLTLLDTNTCINFRNFLFFSFFLIRFISLDCGLPVEESPYDNAFNGLTFTSDSTFIQTGKSGRIHKNLNDVLSKQYLTLKYFPEGKGNCYSLDVKRDTKYLIAVSSVYGIYDGLNLNPSFDIYIGPNK